MPRGGKIEVDALTALQAQITNLTEQVNSMNCNAIDSTNFLVCELYGGNGHMSVDC
ncbi:conserved hypothetical protein [Ricinus communis]|uniref:Uncharacterized protein n=1 Tax=Ricinus communis TaxID=3988 RepID=B9SGG4_RICCO|nr:conserved hypothetical protein [Ricinus communis]